MSITGRELITRIQSLVNVQTRAETRSIADEMAERVLPDLAQHGAARFAENLFEFWRRVRRDQFTLLGRERLEQPAESAHVKSTEFMIDVFEAAMTGWGDFDRHKVRDFYLTHLDFFEDQLRRFNQARSKATNILAVFRPFKDKYLSSWTKTLDMYPGDQVQTRATELESRTIETPEQLDAWMNDLYALFADAAVFKSAYAIELKVSDNTSRRLKIKSVPFGMISEASERIYRQRWANWFAENERELQLLVQGERKTSGLSDIPRQYFTSYQPGLMNSNGPLDLNAMSSNHGQLPTIGTQVTLQVTSVANDALTAQRVWTTETIAAEEIGAWLTVLSTLWQVAGPDVVASLKFVNSGGESELNLPSMSFTDVKTMLPNLIKDYR